MTAGVLVIGYGNTLRGDDGIGPAVAEAVGARALPGVRSIVAHQLTPDLAADLAEAIRVVFVDAAVGDVGVTVSHLVPSPGDAVLSHASSPRALLALTRAVFGRAPDAWIVTAGGSDFGYGEGLTASGEEGARLARQRVEGLLCGWASTDGVEVPEA